MSEVSPQDALLIINRLSSATTKSDDAFHFTAAENDARPEPDDAFAYLSDKAAQASALGEDDKPAEIDGFRGEVEDVGAGYDEFFFDI